MSASDAVRVARGVVVLHRHLEQATRQSAITLAQYRLLLLLEGKPQRAGLLAKVSSLSKASISLAVNAARDRGWVATGSDGDGRATVVTLTAEGRAQLKAFEGELAAAIAEALPAPELDVVARAFDRAATAAKARQRGADRGDAAQED